MNQIRDLEIKERTGEFITLYIQIQQILDILPDTSKLQITTRLELIPRLDEVGAYEEAIRQSWEYLDHVELKNTGRTENDGLKIYGLLAGMYNAIGNSDSAYFVYQLAIQKSKHHPDELRISAALNNMGLYFNNLEKYDSALVHFILADSVLTSHSDKTDYWKKFHGTVRSNMANLYFDLGEYEKAKILYQEMFDYYKNLGIEIGEIYSGISLVRANIGLGICEGQEEFLNSMSLKLDPLDFSQKLDFNLYLWEVCSKLWQCTGDINKAFIYEQKRMQLKDSLHNRKEIAIVQSNSQLSDYASEQLIHQLQIEKAEHEKDKQLARLRLWIIILMTLGAILTPFSFYYYYKQRLRLQAERSERHNTNRLLTEEKVKTNEQEKRLLGIELENKKKDLADMAISLSQKQEWATELNQHLLIIESSKGNKRSRELIKLKDNVRSQIYVNKQTDLLRENIDALCTEYYEKLREEFPSLTKTEIKLCSFIRLKLSIAQIAHLQHIDTASVVVGRYRLKKKLGLGTDENLDKFLQSF